MLFERGKFARDRKPTNIRNAHSRWQRSSTLLPMLAA